MRLATKFLLLFALIAGAGIVFWFAGMRDFTLPDIPIPGRTPRQPIPEQPHAGTRTGTTQPGPVAQSPPARPTPQMPPVRAAQPPFTSSRHEGRRITPSELHRAVAGADPPGATLVPDLVEGVIIDGPLAGARDDNIHVVQDGDTLSRIASARLGAASRWGMIAEANPRVNPDRLHIGQRLVIPRLGEPAAKPAAARIKLYVVKKNDTLIGIARKVYGDSSRYMDIWRANRATLPSPNSTLHVGRKLRLPAA